MAEQAELLPTGEAWIDGRWQPAADGRRFAVQDPADGSLVAEVADCGAAEAEAAIAAAARAFSAWREQPAKARAARLLRWHALIEQQREALAVLMSREQGKPLAEARGEIGYGASFVQWFAEQGKRAYGEIVPATARDRRMLVLRQPMGVVAAITPWNFPMAMITRKLAPALAAGCTVVVKPSELTPLSALALAMLAEQAGFPRGVINVVPSTDAATIGRVFTDSPIVRKLSFTGSTAVGKRLMAQCASTVKKLSLELGGNAPALVFDDADLAIAERGVIGAKFRNAGQACIAVNRLLVQRGVHDAFVARLAEALAAMKLGPGLAPGTDIGPLIDDRAVAKVERLVADALANGARLVLGGCRRPELGQRYYTPTLLTDVRADMAIAREEIFGPVLAVQCFDDEAEAIALANATPHGLAAYLFTEDYRRILRVGEALEAGMVGVNEGLISNEATPFGGWKESGIGSEGGWQGLDAFLETKTLCLGGLA